MKNSYVFVSAIIVLSVIFLSSCGKNTATQLSENRDRLFDSGWKFIKDSLTGAEQPDFNDTTWRTLDLPHDWSIEDLAGEQTAEQIGPFSMKSPGQGSTAYAVGGTAWYRKQFTLNENDQNKIVQLRFDGVYMESDVWLNGKHIGFHPYGYTPFYYDLTPHLKPAGEPNVLAVRVNNTGKNSRWYSGSGIYRHVWLTVTNPIHLAMWGAYITTPEVTTDKALVKLELTTKNDTDKDSKITIQTNIISPSGTVVATKEAETEVKAKSAAISELTLEISKPELWSVETPNLYSAEIKVLVGSKIQDTYRTHLGIRSIEFSAEKGFLLNGQNLELKGACMHHDNGLLGSATFDRAEERRVEVMKANGYNAIRTSHNPPSQQFLDACDRLGMLVIDEAFDMWERPKNPMDYSRFFKEWWQRDLESFILRDRNHPSVIMWSIGNEINERADTSGLEITKNLSAFIKKLDNTRPITAAICSFWDHPGREWSATTPAFDLLGIGGYNYQWQQYVPDHEKFPTRIMAGTESIAKEAYENWQQVINNSWVIGDFVWTGMDYLGEASIGHTQYLDAKQNDSFGLPWQWFNAWCGDIDICGNKKPQSYYRDVVWKQSKLEMAVHAPVPKGKIEKVSFWGWYDELQSWTWNVAEGTPMKIRVFSTCTSVRLLLNGKLIAEKPVSADTKLIAEFEVPYSVGELKAIGIEDGKEVATKIFKTASAATEIKLIAEHNEVKADRNDLAYFQVEIVDKDGVLLPEAAIPLKITINGAGELIAAGNASPNTMASFHQPTCTTFRGKALIIIRPLYTEGDIKVTVESENLKSATVLVKSIKK